MKIMRVVLLLAGIATILWGIGMRDTGDGIQSNARPVEGFTAIVDNGTIAYGETELYGGNSDAYEAGGSIKGGGVLIIVAGVVMLISALCIKEEKNEYRG